MSIGKKSLYDKNEKVTQDAIALEGAAFRALGPLFIIYMEKGYTVREISHVIQGAVQLLESEKVI
jgi:hypothetical protein